MSLNTNSVNKYIYIFISLILLLTVVADLIPEAQVAGDKMNDTGITFASFFASNGFVWTLVVIGLFLIVIAAVLPKQGR